MVECVHCGEQLPTGIVSISEHWNRCIGKDFKQALMAAREKKKLTIDEVVELREKYFGVKPLNQKIHKS